jgi:hypothetical protein
MQYIPGATRDMLCDVVVMLFDVSSSFFKAIYTADVSRQACTPNTKTAWIRIEVFLLHMMIEAVTGYFALSSLRKAVQTGFLRTPCSSIFLFFTKYLHIKITDVSAAGIKGSRREDIISKNQFHQHIGDSI